MVIHLPMLPTSTEDKYLGSGRLGRRSILGTALLEMGWLLGAFSDFALDTRKCWKRNAANQKWDRYEFLADDTASRCLQVLPLFCGDIPVLQLWPVQVRLKIFWYSVFDTPPQHPATWHVQYSMLDSLSDLARASNVRNLFIISMGIPGS